MASLSKDVEHLIAACSTCQCFQPQQADTSLKQQPIANRPLVLTIMNLMDQCTS